MALSIIHGQGLVYGALSPSALYLVNGTTLELSPFIKLCFTDQLRPVGNKLNGGLYSAPEGIGSPSSDSFSLGVLLHFTLCGFLPNKITNDDLDMSQASWDVVSESAQILVKTLLRIDPKQRPSAAFLAFHPWLNSSQESKDQQLDTALSLMRQSFSGMIRRMSMSRSPEMEGAHHEVMQRSMTMSKFEVGEPEALAENNLPLTVLVISRSCIDKKAVFGAVAENVGGLYISYHKSQRVEFRLMDLEELESSGSPGTLLWHPCFRGVDVVIHLESMLDTLKLQDTSAEAVDAFRSVFNCEHFLGAQGSSPAVPIVLAFTELKEFRDMLVRDKWLGNVSPESAEYQQRENKLIHSITNRFEKIVSENMHRFKLVLLPSHVESATRPTRASSSGGAVPSLSSSSVSTSEAGKKRNFTMRKNKMTLNEITARYSALVPAALEESGPEAARTAIHEAVLNSVITPRPFSMKDSLQSLPETVATFRMSVSDRTPLIDGSINAAATSSASSIKFLRVPQWLTSLTLRNGTSDMTNDLFSNFPESLTFLHLSHFDVTLEVSEVIFAALKINACLETLVLHHCGISKATAPQVFEFLQTNSVLNCLDVSFNNFGNEGVNVIVESLVGNCVLKRLHCRQCGVQSNGLLAWNKVLKTNHVLEYVDLAENTQIGTELQLIESLDTNVLPALEVFALSHAPDPEFVKALQKVALSKRRLSNDLMRFSYLHELSKKAPEDTVDLSFCRQRRMPWDELTVSFHHVKRLNLSYNSFASLPEVVFSMNALEELIVVNAGLTELSKKISRLDSLKVLSLSQNHLTVLPESLCSLTLLSAVDLRYNDLLTLPENIGSLTNLKALLLQHNEIVRLPHQIFSLQSLRELLCEGNPMHVVLVEVYRQFAAQATTLDLTRRNISGIPGEVAMLNNITELILSHNNLEFLPPQIMEMKSVIALDISHNRFDSLPKRLSLMPLTILKMDGNPLTYLDQGLKEAPIRTLFEALTKQKERQVSWLRTRVALVGDQKCGKSSLAQVLCPKIGAVDVRHVQPFGVRVHDWIIDIEKDKKGSQTTRGQNSAAITVSLLDFVSDSCRDMIPMFLFDQTVYVYVLSLIGDPSSTSASLRYWLDNIRVFCPRSCVVIVGTHQEMVDSKVGSLVAQRVKDMIPQYNQIKAFVSGTCTNAKKSSDITNKIISVIRNQAHLSELVPFSYLEFHHALVMKKSSYNPPIMSMSDFEALAHQHDIENHKQVLDLLNNMGITCSARDSSHVILDLQWFARLLDSVYKMNSFSKDGLLSSLHFAQVWQTPHFLPHCHELYVQLLSEMNTMTDIKSMYAVPFLLSDERPTWIWSVLFATTMGTGNAIINSDRRIDSTDSVAVTEVRRIFSFTLVPFGLFSQFIAKVAQLVRPLQVWKNLFVAELLNDASTKLTMEAKVAAVGSGSFDLRVKGPSWVDAVELVSCLLEDLAGEKSFVRSLQYHCSFCNEHHVVAHAEILNLVAQKAAYYVCPNGSCTRVEILAPEIDLGLAPFPVFKASTIEISKEDSSLVTHNEVVYRALPLEDGCDLRDAWACGSLKHSHIAHGIGIVQDTEPVLLLSECTPLGSLDKLLQDRVLQVEWRLVLRIALDVVDGLAFAHHSMPPVVHGKLESSHVLLCSLDASNKMAVAKVTAFCSMSRKGVKEDVRAFGELLAELLTREKKEGQDVPAWTPVAYASLVRMCRHLDESVRPELAEIKKEILDMEATVKLNISQMKAVVEEEGGDVVMTATQDPTLSKESPRKTKLKKKKKRIKKTVVKKVKKSKNTITKKEAKGVVGLKRGSEKSQSMSDMPETGTPTIAPIAIGRDVNGDGTASAKQDDASKDSKLAASSPVVPFTPKKPKKPADFDDSSSELTASSVEDEDKDDNWDSSQDEFSSEDEARHTMSSPTGPCLQCRMEKSKIACQGYLGRTKTTEDPCAVCNHAFDAHAVALHLKY